MHNKRRYSTKCTTEWLFGGHVEAERHSLPFKNKNVSHK